MADGDAVQAGVGLLQLLQLLDNDIRGTGQETACPHRIIDPRQVGSGRAGWVGHPADLLVAQRAHQPKWPEHLHVLFVVFRRDLESRLLSVGDVDEEPDAQVLTELQIATRTGIRVPERLDHGMHSTAFGDASANNTFDPMPGHEVQPSRGGALNRLPALDRQVYRTRHQRDLLEGVASVRHLRRDRIVLALV